MDMEKLRAVALAALLGMAAALLPAHSAELTEAKIFEWWDDGTIEAKEANEMLELMDEGNMQEACALAEIYANEPCGTESADGAPASKTETATSTKAPRDKKPQKKYGGSLSTRMVSIPQATSRRTARNCGSTSTGSRFGSARRNYSPTKASGARRTSGRFLPANCTAPSRSILSGARRSLTPSGSSAQPHCSIPRVQQARSSR